MSYKASWWFRDSSEILLMNKNYRFRKNLYTNRAVNLIFSFYQSIAPIDAQILLKNQRNLTVSFHEKLINIRPENVFTIGLCTFVVVENKKINKKSFY